MVTEFTNRSSCTIFVSIPFCSIAFLKGRSVNISCYLSHNTLYIEVYWFFLGIIWRSCYMTCNERCTNIFTCIYIYRVAHYKIGYCTCRRIFFVECLTYCRATKFAQSHNSTIFESCRLNSLWINNCYNSSRSSCLYTIDYEHGLRNLLCL